MFLKLKPSAFGIYCSLSWKIRLYGIFLLLMAPEFLVFFGKKNRVLYNPCGIDRGGGRFVPMNAIKDF